MAPLGRNVSHEEVGGFERLLGVCEGVTGEILHVDGGYHAMGTQADCLINNKPQS